MRHVLLPALLAMLCLACARSNATEATVYDVLIVGGTVVIDGHQAPVEVDVAIAGDRIVALGHFPNAAAHRTIDARGMLVTPGFIDTHNHADDGGARADFLRQGVTTIVVGNCGGSASIRTLARHYDGLEGTLGVNYVGLIGHNQLRRDIRFTGERPSDEQMEEMKHLVAEGMAAGAFGMSTGLTYHPGFNARTEELVELARVVAEHGGVYASHIRNEGPRVLEAVAEAIRIGRESGCRVQLSHAKVAGPGAWGLAGEYLALVNAANAAGIVVYIDQYPYTASQTGIGALFPLWARENRSAAVEAQRRAELERDVTELLAGRGGAERVFLSRGPFAGRFLSDIADSLGKDPVAVLIDDIGVGGGSAVYHMMLEDDLRELMAHPHQMIASDGPTDTHPRGHGTFPRFWGRYVRELAMFDHADAVRRTSTLAAGQFGLLQQYRGRLAPGWFADIVIFDPAIITDGATFEEPTNPPKGVHHVLVNGAVALADSEPTGQLAGRVLRHSGAMAGRGP
jgi:N-acyl-D-aspartate/D-glutamate deacylase